MAATIASMSVLTAKCLSFNKSPPKFLSFQNLPKGLSVSKPSHISNTGAAIAIAGAIFSTVGSMEPAFAAQQIAEIAQGDNRGFALLLPIVPAIGWVLFNILQPSLNQLNRMRSEKGVIIGLGGIGGGLAALGLMPADGASAAELSVVADLAEASSSDGRGLLLLIVVAPAIGWVLFNILQPALNQINRMRSG